MPMCQMWTLKSYLKPDANNDTVEDAFPVKGNGEKADKDKEECNDEELLARPPHGTEVFVGNLPQNITKEDLTSLCEKHGEVFEVNVLSSIFK